MMVWFDISDLDWLGDQRPRKKVKLIARMHSFQTRMVAELRAAGIAVEKIAKKIRRQPDSAILELAQNEGRIPLTIDGDFWDDRKHPLQRVRTGVIYVAEEPGQHDRVLRAFGLVYGCFAKSFFLDW